MSFSYKTLNSNDIALTSYIANKQWEVNNTTLSQNGVAIYIGENLPINKANPFDPAYDSQTTYEEYRRLVFDSIKNLYYQNYVSGTLSGEFYLSSSFFNYEQSTIISGTIRNLPTVTGSAAIGHNPTVYNSHFYDVSSSLYDDIAYDPDKGSKIVVISIDQNIFGSGLSPNTIVISGSTYNIQDDGEGNLFDSLATSSLYVGNVFYSQGLIVLTNQDYLCVLGAPPTTTNDNHSYLNVNHNPQTIDILANDFADCGAIDQTSVQIFSVPGFSFPSYTQTNGTITITPDQSSVIPGYYKLNYTVGNLNGVRSNTSSVDLTITSQSIQVTNIISSSACYFSTASVPVTFSINYGVPPYSYSLDNGTTYTGVPGFFNKTVSGSITSSLTSTIYIKDYTGTIVTQSYNSWYPTVTYDISSIKLPCSGSSNGRLGVTNVIDINNNYTGVSASLNGGSYFRLPRIFTGLTSGSYTLRVKDINECVTSSIVNLDWYTELTASVTQSNITCFGANNGYLSVAFTNVIDICTVNLTDPTGSYYYQDIPLSDFPNNTITASNLGSGSWDLNVNGTLFCSTCCQVYSNTFNITSPTQPTLKTTSSYIDSCSNAIIFSGSGGTAPYTYYAVETSSNTIYSSTSSSVALNGLTGGTFETYIVDTNGCVSTSSLVTSYGRTWNYTGSYCVQSGGNNTGYISSSGIQQNFTTGPYSGSLVTSSYSSGSILLGPTINTKQLFTSGTVDSIIPCETTKYNRYYQDYSICPPGGCFAPVLVTATPLYCTTNWTSSYTVTYNSSSALASSTIIEYSYNSNFSPKVTHSINNSSPVMTPFSTLEDFGVFNSPDQIMYFRAYNSCSIGTTSSYSNVLTASCATTPPPPLFTVQIKNKSGRTLRYSTGSVSYSINNNQSASISFIDQTKSISLNTVYGVHFIGEGINFTANVSSSTDVNNNVYTLLQNPIDSFTYPNYTVINEYTNGGYNYLFIDDIDNSTSDLLVDIDRDVYTNAGTITLTIQPYFVP